MNAPPASEPPVSVPRRSRKRHTPRAWGSLPWWAAVLTWSMLIWNMTGSRSFTPQATQRAIVQAVAPPAARRPVQAGSVPHPPRWVQTADLLMRKAAHVFLYGLLALFLRQALQATPGVRRPGLWALALAALYGAVDEWHQTHVQGRTGTAADIVLDAAAAAAAVLAVHWSGPWRPRRGLTPGP